MKAIYFILIFVGFIGLCSNEPMPKKEKTYVAEKFDDLDYYRSQDVKNANEAKIKERKIILTQNAIIHNFYANK